MFDVVVLLIICEACICSDGSIVTEIDLVEPVLNCQFDSNFIHHTLTVDSLNPVT